MIKINKIRSASPIDFAAEELKKYLRMMMPEGGDISISYDPEAKDGFRLGLMQDFGLDVSDAEDTELDDILYIDCDTYGGIIAGDNPRSVLLSVYEYLRRNGCRWLFPGVDGEFIPMQDIKSVKYRHKPSMRYRGQCNEGAEFQRSMLETIEFMPKIGMNIFMLEFENPHTYYRGYYNHEKNKKNRPPEPISPATALQWKKQCEAEMAKRGMQIHDVGHGFTTAPFGIDTFTGWSVVDQSIVPEGMHKYLAEVNGKRELYRSRVLNTQFCMSNPKGRRIVVDYVVKYAKNHSYVDYLHVWLADDIRNHCECSECRKKTPSDWYVVLLNEIDEMLKRENLNTRVAFCVYTDTTWEPKTEKINNPDRFSMLFAPISRKYTETLPSEPLELVLPDFVLNDSTYPESLAEFFEHRRRWKSCFDGNCFAYEYHFCKSISHDPAGIGIAKRLVEDVEAYANEGIRGIIQDGTQRVYFPTGIAFYAYARKMFDFKLDYADISKEYFECAFGEDYKSFESYLNELSIAFDQGYLAGEKSKDPKISPYYNPDYSENLDEIDRLVREGRELIKSHYNSDYRIRTVSVRLLEKHAELCELFTYLLRAVRANEMSSDNALAHFNRVFGRHEAEIELYFDHMLFSNFLKRLLDDSKNENITTLD